MSEKEYPIFAPDHMRQLAIGILRGQVMGVPYVRRVEAEALLKEYLKKKTDTGTLYKLLCNTGPRGSGKTRCSRRT